MLYYVGFDILGRVS